jgi:hypothetical protein
VGKIAENIKSGTVKLRFYCGGDTIGKAVDSLREYVVCWQRDFVHGFVFI